jgi:putative nucleotidyltransferase with HDIG domain
VPAAAEPSQTYVPIPLEGMAGQAPLPFPLYLQTAERQWVLYRDTSTQLNADHIGRLLSEGVDRLFIRAGDRVSYYRRVEHQLDDVLKDKRVPIQRRADVLHGVAVEMATDLLARAPDRQGVARAQKVLLATSGLLLREQQGFHAVRRLLKQGGELKTHSLAVGFLAMGLARHVLAADPGVLLVAGLAGLLHDVGRVGRPVAEHDPDHARRGYDELRRLDLPDAVCDSAWCHHERFDGSGFPRGLRGEEIPEMARVVGLCNTFDKVYSGQQPRVSVFDALRIMAQAWRGCFEDRLAQGFVTLFRG